MISEELTHMDGIITYTQLKYFCKIWYSREGGILETVAEYAYSRGYHRVGLLGTIFTMEKDFLRNAFVQKGIEVVVPDYDTRVLVNERISKELEYGIVKDSTIEELNRVIFSLKHVHGIEAVGKDKSNRCNDRSAEKNRFAGRISCCRNSSSARTSDRFYVSPIRIWMYFQAVPE